MICLGTTWYQLTISQRIWQLANYYETFSFTFGNILVRYVQVGQAGGGERVHPKGEVAMAVSVLGYEKPSFGARWANFLVLALSHSMTSYAS